MASPNPYSFRPPPANPVMNNIQNRGFTLLEAIVALVILSTAGLAMFSWLNANLQTTHRIQVLSAELKAKENALEYMKSINPMQVSQGQAIIGNITIKWESKPITSPMDGANYPNGMSLYQIALYETSITLDKTDAPSWTSFKLQQMGYRKVREKPNPFITKPGG